MRQVNHLSVAVIIAIIGTSFAYAQSTQGRTFAFLVACGDYDKTQLNPVPFTVTEMKVFRDVLIDSGVSDKNIVFLHDKTEEPRRFLPTRANILDEFKLLMERLRPEDAVIVALSGHGVQFKGDKFGYFCPLDTKLSEDSKDRLLPMEGDNGFLKLLDRSKAGRKFLIVNACRNNPTSNANLAKQKLDLRDEYNEEAPKGTVMLLACKQGQFSWFYDDKEKRVDRRNRSLFMYHLTEAWKGSYANGKKLTLDHILAEVANRVEADAPADFGKNQMPIVKRKFEGQWELGSATAIVIKQGKYTLLPLQRVASAISTRGMVYDEKSKAERLAFADWSPVTFKSVPFHLLDPQGDKTPNVLLFYSPKGKFPPKMPKSVKLPCNASAAAVHLLSGVSVWGYPQGKKGSITLTVRFHYQTGNTEDHFLRNGEHFADYLRRLDVPSSEFAFDLDRRQIRYLAIRPLRSEIITHIEFIAGTDESAPIIMSVTVEGRQ